MTLERPDRHVLQVGTGEIGAFSDPGSSVGDEARRQGLPILVRQALDESEHLEDPVRVLVDSHRVRVDPQSLVKAQEDTPLYAEPAVLVLVSELEVLQAGEHQSAETHSPWRGRLDEPRDPQEDVTAHRAIPVDP